MLAATGIARAAAALIAKRQNKSQPAGPAKKHKGPYKVVRARKATGLDGESEVKALVWCLSLHAEHNPTTSVPVFNDGWRSRIRSPLVRSDLISPSFSLAFLFIAGATASCMKK